MQAYRDEKMNDRQSLIIRAVLRVCDDFLLLDKEVEHAVDYVALNAEYFGRFIAVYDSLLH